MAVLDLCSCSWAFSSYGKRRLLLGFGAQASHCGAFSCFRVWALGHLGFSGCGAQA